MRVPKKKLRAETNADGVTRIPRRSTKRRRSDDTHVIDNRGRVAQIPKLISGAKCESISIRKLGGRATCARVAYLLFKRGRALSSSINGNERDMSESALLICFRSRVEITPLTPGAEGREGVEFASIKANMRAANAFNGAARAPTYSPFPANITTALTSSGPPTLFCFNRITPNCAYIS